MFPAAHLGLGSVIGRLAGHALPFSMPFGWLLLGTMLPDLMDKPCFWAMGVIEHFTTGGWVPGKRGVAHTLLFLAGLAAVAAARRSQRWAAVSVGDGTHLILDFISKAWGAHDAIQRNVCVLMWPACGFTFPTLAYGLHGRTLLWLEALGLLLLVIQLSVKPWRPRGVTTPEPERAPRGA